jgi:hypothetical protein
MELRMIVYAAGALLGMVIIYTGVRLLHGGGSGRPTTGGMGASANSGASQPDEPPSFTTSGAMFIAVGLLMIVLAGKMFTDLRHEQLTSVSPLSYLNLDMPPPPPDDTRPQADSHEGH